MPVPHMFLAKERQIIHLTETRAGEEVDVGK